MDGIPRVAEPVDAAALEHQQAVLHHVNLHHAQRRAGIVGHGVYGKIVCWSVRHEPAHSQRTIVHERRRRDGGFAANHDFRSICARLRFIRLFNHRSARDSCCAHCVRCALGQIRKSAWSKHSSFPARLDLHFAVKDIEKTLRRSRPQRAAGYELRGHLGKACTQLRSSVDDKLHPLCAGQRRANKRVRRLQQIVGLECCCALIQVGARAASFRGSAQSALLDFI